jgi:hypothetical protein
MHLRHVCSLQHIKVLAEEMFRYVHDVSPYQCHMLKVLAVSYGLRLWSVIVSSLWSESE